jgi:transposase
MIVLGADMHKGSHTVAAVTAPMGELVAEKTVKVGERGFAAILGWARELGEVRVWALEDCRQVSGSFERFLLVSGERVVRVATRLMAGARRGGRERGKSDVIDAIAVARAALREGVDRLPAGVLAGVELDIRLLVDHRERLVGMRTALINDLRWHLHDLWPEHDLPSGALRTKKRVSQLARRLARAEQTARVRIARDELGQIRELTQTIEMLQLEIAGAQRFSSDAKLARASGIAPIPVSSGKTNRHRLDRGGNRQINTAIHRVALTRARCHPETKAYVARKREEGKTHREAIRCLKRHLTRRVWHLLQPPDQPRTPSTS